MRLLRSLGRRIRRRLGLRGIGDSGQALVEFALVAVILLILILGIVDLARAWNAYQVITDAAREAARTAVVDDPTVTQDSVVRVVEGALNRASLDPSQAEIQFPDGFKTGTGNPTTVAVTYPWEFQLIGLFLDLDGNGAVDLRTAFVMRNE